MRGWGAARVFGEPFVSKSASLRRMRSSTLAKTWFVLSVAVLSMAYGMAATQWGWFPSSFAERAWKQLYWGVQETSIHLLNYRVYERTGVRAVHPKRMQPGLTLVTSSWKEEGELDPELRLMNREGDVLHKWRVDREALFPAGLSQRRDPERTDIHGSYLLPSGDVLANLEYVGMVRLDACGEVQWRLTEGNHHSIARAQDGSFWVPAVSNEPRATSARFPDGFPGLDGKAVWVDRMLRVSEDGTIQQDLNVLDLLYRNGLQRYIPKVLGGRFPESDDVPTDITHLNDIEPLSPSMADEYPQFEAGDLAVSLRSLSLVFVVDPDTKKVKWHASDPFIYQHDPDFLGDGRIGVFDNNSDLTERGSMLGGSRILALRPHTGTIDVRFPTQRSDPFYTALRGKWQPLDNGNMLLTESGAGRVVEVDSTGRTVWEWVHPSYDRSVPWVTKASRHDLAPEEVASWPCSSARPSTSR